MFFDADKIYSLQQLIGWIVLDSYYDGSSIYLLTHAGCLELQPHGDCCAHCYIQHVSYSDALKNAVILDVEDIEGEREDLDGDVVDNWGHRIKTDKGICSLEMRVEHNGYYGGSLHFVMCNMLPKKCKLLEDF